jgi:oxygen-independent coproporphyrinogen-3 oxidase
MIPGRPWREATIEAAPGTISAGKARAWVDAGIDRVSLGVQSFVESEIRRTGRRHTEGTVRSDVEILRQAGIRGINIDLIAGLAGQTRGSWAESLDCLLSLEPGHASIYMLEADEDSRLGQELLSGGMRYGAADVPDDGLIAELYQTAVDRLAHSGLRRYEISNFAIAGEESVHNLKYWRREPYIGFGLDAHSFDGADRWANPGILDEYLAGGKPEREPAQPDEEYFLGLRLAEGIPAATTPTTEAERDGLLERVNGRLRLTDRGIVHSNAVFAEFLQ